MKGLFGLLILAISFTSLADTAETAADLYSKRGEDPNNAYLAREIYKNLADNAATDFEQAAFKTKYSEANSYYGSQQTEKQTKLDIFTLGTDMAKEAVVLLTGGDPYSTVPKDPNHRSALALAHYWAAANLGQWADTRGPLHSLGQWPNLEKHLAAIIANDESTEEYGAYRIWGRAKMKLPGFKGGSIDESEEYLAYAYNNTISSTYSTSTNPKTTNFYLETMAKRKKSTATFCEVYTAYLAFYALPPEEIAKLNPTRVPEVKVEWERFQTENTRAQKYFKDNCSS